ncbi:MAG: hypothetical protein JXB14_07345 [Candidatus Altiarchaeota archaeon]|nr:hypothetical protein [Candidatus Altiarchaeota archaeon]
MENAFVSKSVAAGMVIGALSLALMSFLGMAGGLSVGFILLTITSITVVKAKLDYSPFEILVGFFIGIVFSIGLGLHYLGLA